MGGSLEGIMFSCETCGPGAKRLIYGKEGFGCDRCYSVKNNSFTGHAHESYLGKGYKRMTYAEAMRIKTNKLRADGQYKPDWRWRSSGKDWGD